MSGTLNDLTANQADALKELKSKLNDIQKPIHDVHQLLRFLRARKFDIKKTEAIIRQDIVWRAQMKVDTIHEWFKIPEVCLKYWPGGSLGLDKLGHVVWLSPIGNVDPKGLIYSVKTGDIIRTNIYVIERMVKEQEVISQKLGRHIEGITLIVDLDNLSASHMWKPGMAVMIELFTIIEEHYPGFIHQMFVVRPTKLLPIAYYLIRPCFTEDTRERIHVLGSNWREVLLKHIDAEILPVHWGGTLTDTDGVPNMCPSKINLGGKVPSFFYKKGSDLNHDDMTFMELPGKRSTEVKHRISTAGSILSYEFKTASNDIAFGIYRLSESGEKISILDEKRYCSHIIPEDGEVLFEEPGLYVVKFDNRGSAFQKTRKLSYWMEVIEPKIERSSTGGAFFNNPRDSGYYQENQYMTPTGPK
eukprot:XP_011664473.1 PREDICTED: SEC14-like protein 2 isoform X1 [Strongylocentrotus purpuratus]